MEMTDHSAHVRRRLVGILQNQDVDAVVVFGAENVQYLTGHRSWFAYQPIPNAVAAVGFRDPDCGPVLVVTAFEEQAADGAYAGTEVRVVPAWMGIDDPHRTRPGKPIAPGGATLAKDGVLREVAAILRDYSLDSRRVAFELDALDPATAESAMALFQPNLSPKARPILSEARRVKSDYEIDVLSRAVEITEQAIADTVAWVRPGVSHKEISRHLNSSIYAHGGDGVKFALIAAGSSFSPVVFGSEQRLNSGDLLKFDVGAVVAGYGADIARTFSLGRPPSDVMDRYDALMAGFHFLLAEAGPGVRLDRLYLGCMERVRAAGLSSYARSHVGHSLGLDRGIEEWPFVERGSDMVLEENMVICLETPYHAWGLGGLQCEDVVVIKQDGAINLCTLSRELVEL